MVRHEAAEALGSIASPDCLQLLTDYCKDPEPIVADSCVVSFGSILTHMQNYLLHKCVLCTQYHGQHGFML